VAVKCPIKYRDKYRYKYLGVAIFLVSLAVLAGAAGANAQERRHDEPVITERVIKIEGTVENPRVIFIVSRSRLWKGDLLEKSFVDGILEPVYPETQKEKEEATLPVKGGKTQWKR